MKKTIKILAFVFILSTVLWVGPLQTKAATKGVAIKYLGKVITEYSCECAFQITNKTGKDIDLSLSILGKSAKGKELEVQQISCSCLGKGKVYAVSVDFEDKNVQKFEYGINWKKSYYKSCNNYLSIKKSKNGKNLILTIKNKNSKEIYEIRVCALFYKKGKLVGTDTSYYDDLSGKGKTFLQLNSDNKFDKYKLYYRAFRE